MGGTRRQQIATWLAERAYTLDELVRVCGVSKAVVAEDIRHIARSPRLWPHAVREGARPPVGELLWGGALELSGRANGRSYEREILDALHRLRARDTSVLALFSEGDRGLAYLERHLGPGYRSVLEDNAVAFDIIRGPDHTFRPLWSHDLLRRALEGQLQRIGFLEFETERSLEPERWPFLEPRLTCRVGTMGRTEEVIDGACFRVNSPQVIHETIDGEVIVISLATGSYYSMKGPAADAWELIQRPAGVGAADLLEALAARFDTPASELEAAFGPFLAELRAEGLVSWTGIEEIGRAHV